MPIKINAEATRILRAQVVADPHLYFVTGPMETEMADASRSKTITKLQVTHNPVPPGQGFSVSAHVSTSGPHHVHGDVEFFADGESLATLRTDSTGVAAYGIGGGVLEPGEHEITATFHGDGYNSESTSEPLVVTVTPAEGQEVKPRRGAKAVEAPKSEPTPAPTEPMVHVTPEPSPPTPAT